jgi:hypothetical protein
MKVLRKYAVAVIIVMLLAGCATLTQQQKVDEAAYKTLASARVTYDQSMSVIADLNKQGKISKDQMQKILSVARAYYNLYQAALKEYVAYHNVPTPDQEVAMQNALGLMSKALVEVLGVYNEFKGGVK